LVPLLLVPLLFLLFGPASKTFNAIGQHTPFGPGPWPRDIVYFNNSDYRTTLDIAIESWEETGIPVSFVETGDRERADLILEDDTQLLRENCLDDPECLGHAPVGYLPLGLGGNSVYLLPPSHHFEEEMLDVVRVQTLVHELGHVLGLWHNDLPCSVMNINSACYQMTRPRVTAEGTYLACGPRSADVFAVRELYGVEGTGPSSHICHDPGSDLARHRALAREDRRLAALGID
jgi:hypothetical protein